jgi:Flp pilus assembly protein TadD
MSLIDKALKQAEKDRRKEQDGQDFIPSLRARKDDKNASQGKRLLIIAAAAAASVLAIFLVMYLLTSPQKTGSPPAMQPVYQARPAPEAESAPVIPLVEKEDGLQRVETTPEEDEAPGNISVAKLQPASPDSTSREPENEVSADEPASNPRSSSLTGDEEYIAVSLTTEREAPAEEQTHLPEKHYNLAVNYFREDRVKEAIQEYDKAIALDPFCVEAYNNKGVLYQKMEMVDPAIREYEEALSLDRKNERVLNNLGTAYYLKGDLEKAKSCYQESLRVNPKNLASYNNLGIALQKARQPKEAKAVFLRALAIDPHHAETHYNSALLYERLGDTAKAVFHYEQFLKFSTQDYALKRKVEGRLASLSRVQTSE